MNRYVLLTAVLSAVLGGAAVLGQEQTADGVEQSTADDDGLVSSAVDAGQGLYTTASEMTKEQEEQLTEAMGDMITYFTKSVTDMTNILEDISNVSENSSETVRKNLVDNLMSYVEDTEMMRQQIGRVMGLRAQFQDTVLKQLYALPISAEDAEKLECELRKQIKHRAGKMQKFMDPSQIPQMSQMSQMPQEATKFMSKMGSSFMPTAADSE